MGLGYAQRNMDDLNIEFLFAGPLQEGSQVQRQLRVQSLNEGRRQSTRSDCQPRSGPTEHLIRVMSGRMACAQSAQRSKLSSTLFGAVKPAVIAAKFDG